MVAGGSNGTIHRRRHGQFQTALIDDSTDEAEERVWMLTSFLTENRAHA